jgi:hypothetical protein
MQNDHIFIDRLDERLLKPNHKRQSVHLHITARALENYK